jgi:hypothetical protein
VLRVAPPSADTRVAFIPVPDKLVIALARQLRPILAEPLPPVPAEIEKQLGPHDVQVAPTLFP